MKTADLIPMTTHLRRGAQHIPYGSSSSLHPWVQDSRVLTGRSGELFSRVPADGGVGARVKYHVGGEKRQHRALESLYLLMIRRRRGRRVARARDGSVAPLPVAHPLVSVVSPGPSRVTAAVWPDWI